MFADTTFIYPYTVIPLDPIGRIDYGEGKVSKQTVRRLAALQKIFQTKSMDETIGILVKRRRKETLDAVFGSDLKKTRKFTEEDRLEDRS